jgi:c-di-GMP-binding flagellar brake protein YcgR
MQELRTAPRYRLPLNITIKRTLASQPFDTFHGRIRDISNRGVYFTSQEQLAEGDKLEFSVTIPAEGPGGAEVSVEAEARVVRVEPKHRTEAQRLGVAAVIERYEIIRPIADAF